MGDAVTWAFRKTKGRHALGENVQYDLNLSDPNKKKKVLQDCKAIKPSEWVVRSFWLSSVSLLPSLAPFSTTDQIWSTGIYI